MTVSCVIDRLAARISLDDVERRNALSVALVEAAHSAFDAAEASEARAIVLTHRGPIFCAGADLSERAKGLQNGARLTALIARIMQSPKPVVAVLRGAARAGGVGLMAACDFVIAPADATFQFTEVRIGVVPAIIATPLLRRVGRARLNELFLSGAPIDAAEAEAIGLITRAVDPSTIDQATADLLADLGRGEPQALAASKSLLDELEGRAIDDALDHARSVSERFFASEAAQQGMQAWREKRNPPWLIER